MATVVERTAEGTIYKCPESYLVPKLDLLTLLFDSKHCAAKEDTPLHISAANPDHRVTKSQAREFTKRTGYALRDGFGIGASGPGKDVVSCISTGHHLLPVIFYGVFCAGGVFSAASPSSTPTELARQLRQGESKLLICNEDTKAVAIAAAKEVGLPETRILVLPNGGDYALKSAYDGKDVVGENVMEWQKITNPKELEESLVVLIYSSGTTGLPKGVKLSHSNLVAESVTTLDPWRAYNAQHNPAFEYRTIGHLPSAHIAGIMGYFINPFYMGGTVYWMPKFDFVLFLEYNKRYRITSFFTVPPIYLAIAKHQAVTDQFDTLEHVVSGAAPLGKELQIAASAKLGKGKTMISQTWGLSETTGSITLLPFGMTDLSGSVSMLIANHTARLVDDEGNDVEVGQPGEVIVKGPVVSKGYLNNPQANAESFKDGWFYTGDIAVFNDGKFFVIDRKKELIKYKGLQVAPAELEALLLSHPGIMDAAVVGVLAEGTEVPRAYVVADQDKISAAQIEEFVKENVADYKRLRGGVVFLNGIPKSPSGKILRKDLREMAKQEKRSKL